MKLEELARHSSDAARVGVAHLDLPPLGDDRPSRSWAMPVLAATGVAALVVGGLVVIDRLNTGDDVVSDEPVPAVVEVPRLALPAEAGWTATVASSGDDVVSGRETERPAFTYYGTAGAGDPFGEGDLIVITFDDPSGDDSILPTDGDAVTVRGTDGVLASGVNAGLPPDTSSLEWVEGGPDGTSLEVVLVSHGFDGERLIEIADAMTVDVVAKASTPADDLGLEQVAQASGTPFDAFRTSADASLIGYEDSTGTDFLVISASRDHLDREAAALRWWMPDMTATTVDDRPGYLFASSELTGVGGSLIWAPSDGIVADITYFGADETFDLVSIAESLVELDDATWAALVEAIGIPGATGTDEFDEVYGESTGTADDVAYAWALGTQNGDLCFQIQVGVDGVGSCQLRSAVDVPTAGARTIDGGTTNGITHVVIAADPSVDRVIDPGDRFVVERVDADGVAWFVAVGVGDDVTFEVVAEGVVVGTVGVEAEAIAEAVGPVDDGAITAEAGLADMTVIAEGRFGDHPWEFGRQEDSLCMVASGDGVAASCLPDSDVVVFAPVDIGGEQRTMVALRDVPTCVQGVILRGPTVDLTAVGVDELHSYDLWVAFGASDGWMVRLDTGAGGEAVVDLPSDSGVADWPTALCDG